jgi:hypothetical protein
VTLRRWNVFFAVAAALLLTPTVTRAQNFGAQVDWGSDTDIGVGARAEWPMTNVFTTTGAFSKAFLITSFDFYFPDCGGSGVDCNSWELNGNLGVPIPAQATVKPYLGGGLNISRTSASAGGVSASDTNIGINLLGGIKFPLSTLTGYGEARVVVGDADQFVLTFGILFGGKK